MYQGRHPPRSSRESRSGTDAPRNAGALCLIRIANFRSLRRELGRDGLAILTDRVFDLLGRHPSVTQLELPAPDMIEVHLSLSSQRHLKSELIKLVALLDGPVQPGPRPLRLECIVGATLADDALDEVSLIERAEYALSLASSTDPIMVSSDTDDEVAAQREWELTADLPFAALRDELTLSYQPKLSVRKREINSCEALIRWNHPELGLVMPDSFIHLADRSGEIAAITLWAIERAIADQKAMADQGHELRIFVNISGRLLTDDKFMHRACAIVTRNKADIGFEITETSVIQDPDIAIENLTYCAEAGIVLAIDDYGSGLSSLAYLKRLPVKELKIDKMFVTGLTSSHRDPLIVRSTIDLAHALEMEVTAEGVETPAALALLTVMGCEMVQGYLVSQPLNLDDFITYLTDFKFPIDDADMVPSLIRPASFWGGK